MSWTDDLTGECSILFITFVAPNQEFEFGLCNSVFKSKLFPQKPKEIFWFQCTVTLDVVEVKNLVQTLWVTQIFYSFICFINYFSLLYDDA